MMNHYDDDPNTNPTPTTISFTSSTAEHISMDMSNIIEKED